MDSLLIAHGVLWLLMAGLGALLVVLIRQVTALHGRVAPAGALAVNSVLQVGDEIPRMSLETLDGRVIGPVDRGRSQLILFLAPDCPISRSIQPVVNAIGRTEGWLDLLLVSDGDDLPDQRAFADGFPGLDYVLSEPFGRACGVAKLPYAILADGSGRIAGYGIVNSREHLESLMEAQRTGVASIQEFMSRSDDFYRADDPAR